MKKLIVSIFFVVMGLSICAQTDIETQLILTDTVNYPFTSEWQYLSTDIFLFNANNFDKLINELNFNDIGRKRWSKARTEEKLEYLFVSASLKNVKYFGGSDLVYPLYNFQVNRDKEKQYHTYVSDNINHIRIIDNLPLYNAGNNIDAEIKVQAITNNNSDMLLNMIGSQLKNISVMAHPTEAVFSLIGEFGNFIESNTKKREYRFSSTIRLYEQQNFDTRLHSIKVFVLNTENSQPVEIDPLPLQNFLDSTPNPLPDREALKTLLGYSEYPILVVLNYRSMYQMKQISGDEVTQEAIDERRARLLIDFKNGLISDETYQQERDFLRFLTSFVELKKSIEFYQLNQGSGNILATQKSLPKVIMQYNQLLAIEHEMDQKYTKNPIYTSIFVGEYREIISFANLYLDTDPKLKKAKELTQTLKKLEEEKIEEFDSLKCETVLMQLGMANEMGSDFAKNTSEGAKAMAYIFQIEKHLQTNYFNQQLINLKKEQVNDLGNSLANQLKRKAALTNCVQCKNEIINAIDEYNALANAYRQAMEIRKKDNLTQIWNDSVLIYIQQKQLLEKALALLQKSENKPVTLYVLQYHFERLNMHLTGLIGKLQVQFDKVDINTLIKFNESLIREAELTKIEFDFFRRNTPCYLRPNCPEIENLVMADVITNTTFSTDSLRAETEKQLQLFRQFDLIMYAQVDNGYTDSIQRVKVKMVENNRQLIENLDQQLKDIPAKVNQIELNKLNEKFKQLTHEIGNNLNKYCVQFPDDCIENKP